MRTEDLLAHLARQAVREGELEPPLEQLLDVGSLDVACLLQLHHLQHLDGAEAGAVAGGHVLVEGLHGLHPAHLPVLFVHVVRPTARVVADPDAKVLDFQGLALVDGVEGDDLAGALLDLAQLGEEVPEARLCHGRVLGKQPHAVQFGGGVGGGGQLAPNDGVFLHLLSFFLVVLGRVWS